MDMTLPAPKLLVAELQAAMRRNEAEFLGEMKFQSVWLQGVLVSQVEHGTLVLDDGSAVIDLFLTKGHQTQSWEAGLYLLVNGRYCEVTVPLFEVHKIVNLASEPDREALWHLEVVKAHERFYDAPMTRK